MVVNSGSADVNNWTGSLATRDTLASWWGVSATTSQGSAAYTLRPASYNVTIPAGGQISFGFNGNSVTPATPTLTINGQSVPIDGAPAPNPTPTPTPGPTVTPAPTPTAGAPGTPTISILKNFDAGGYDVNWAVYSGAAATTYTLLEDGAVYTTGNAPAASNGQQSGAIHVGDRPYAAHFYQIKLSNAAGSSLSAKQAFLSDGASPILVGPLSSGGASPDAVMQARQLTVPRQTAVSFPLSMIDGTAGAYTVATNNPSVVSFALNGATLTVTGLAPGRASLRITNTAANTSRWLGVRVRKADGSLPGLPDYLAVGSVSQDTDADLALWRNFGAGALNTHVDARYIYLNDGPYNDTFTSWGGNPNNWYGETSPHGLRAYGYVRESLKLGMIPFFVWYNIDGTGDSFTTDTGNAQNADFMRGYFTDLKRMCDLVKAEAPDETVGIVIEPDFIGYLAQNGIDPTTFPARVDAAYTAGVLVHGSDPEYPNTVTGYVQAVNYLFSKNLPRGYFGWEFALWGHPANGWTTPSGTLGLMHLTDEPISGDNSGANATRLGIAKGRAAIYNEGAATTNYYLKCGVASYGASFVSVDKYGLDAGAENGAAANPGASTWFWSQTLWNNYLTFVGAMRDTAKLPVVLWQLPVGHVNHSALANPAGGTFPDLANTYQHYEDSAPAFFYGDVFAPGAGSRYNYFSGATNGTDQDPQANLATNGTTIQWGSAMGRAANAGVRVALFGAGVGNSTAGTGNPPTDAGWWITATQNYYLNNPVSVTPAPPPPPAPRPRSARISMPSPVVVPD